MSDINGATHEEIVAMLAHFYPTMIWRLDGNTYASLTVLPESPIPKPPLEEMRGHLIATRQWMAEQAALRLKEATFEQRYPQLDRDIKIIQAILSGNNTELTNMRNYWNSL